MSYIYIYVQFLIVVIFQFEQSFEIFDNEGMIQLNRCVVKIRLYL